MSNNQASTKLTSIVSSGDIAMAVTRDKKGHLRSRPMEVVDTNDSGEIFFFTTADSDFVAEITDSNFINLSFVKDSAKDFISISGATQLSKDKSAIDAHWSSEYERWIPEGRDNRDLALMKVTLLHGERWENKGTLERLEDFFTSDDKTERDASLEPEKVRA